jgi:surface protein
MKNFITKFPLWMTFLLVSFYSCNQEEESLSALQGSVRFGGISLEFAPMGSPGSRITGNSAWVHIFPNSANLVFTNKVTGQQYDLEYNPNDFSVPYSISLPFGAYEYHSVVEGGIFSAFLPFEVKGEFTLDSQSLEIKLTAETEYGLVTVKNQYVEKASILDGDTESDLVEHQDGLYWFLYVKGETEATLNIKESIQGSTISRQLTIAANKHYNFILKLKEGDAVITDIIMAPFELKEEEILIGSSVFFEENGTIKCPQASPGDKGEVNGKVFEAVDRALLMQKIDENADLTCVCTSLVSDMSYLFHEMYSEQGGETDWQYSPVEFNQPIGNWDVSNVTSMSGMFLGAENFNQPIGIWDVSNVKDMHEMFWLVTDFNQPIGDWNVTNVTNMNAMFASAVSFNQPIGDWDVSNVNNMAQMFSQAKSFNQPIGNWNVKKVTIMWRMFELAINFNQPICNWDVSNVTNTSYMFARANSFNQPIGDWDVSKVSEMAEMFSRAVNFNQPLENWDVSNVTNMRGMFEDAQNFNHPIGDWNVGNVMDISWMLSKAKSFNQPIGNWNVNNVKEMSRIFDGASNFNQPIGNWDVSNVTYMFGMFNNATIFNQNLSDWCVKNIPNEPIAFSTGSALQNANKPVWGTCPD